MLASSRAALLRTPLLRAVPLPLRAAGAAARALRVSAPAQQSDVTQRFPGSGAVTTIDPSKFVDGESLVAHQARVRHDNPANRTFNYAMIGAFRSGSLTPGPIISS
eukprot:scaffold33308_cov118-Isochrysis_galbana.AAC.2